VGKGTVYTVSGDAGDCLGLAYIVSRSVGRGTLGVFGATGASTASSSEQISTGAFVLEIRWLLRAGPCAVAGAIYASSSDDLDFRGCVDVDAGVGTGTGRDVAADAMEERPCFES
jgi:hypothetical protein